MSAEEYFGQNRVCSMSPVEFEKYCCEVLRGYAEEENLSNFTITHNVEIPADDGKYQIDIYATYTALGAEMKVLGECKQYKNRVNREKVVVLADKVRALGAQKGILLSTAGFQSGAIQYAKKHGIALIQIFDTREDWYIHSGGPDANEDEDDPITYGEKQMPVFQAKCITFNSDRRQLVYPTSHMVKEIYKEMDVLFQKQFGKSLLKEIKDIGENKL